MTALSEERITYWTLSFKHFKNKCTYPRAEKKERSGAGIGIPCFEGNENGIPRKTFPLQ